jgi:outer membrane immunogenic protein
MRGYVMTKGLVLGAALTCFIGGSAAAADMPTKAPYRNYQPGTYSWQGFYVGGTAGAGIASSSSSDFNEDFSFQNMHNTGWAGTAGVTVGYNWQRGAAVFGVEADFNWTSFNKSVFNPAFDSQFDSKWNWFTTVRGRFGLAFDRSLVYATAGVAIVKTQNQLFFPEDGCDEDCVSLKKTQVGLAVGAGVEYALADNWSFKAEYLYIKLPSQNLGPQPIDEFSSFQFLQDAHFARVGLNYRFGY